jgi:hypothetical protein
MNYALSCACCVVVALGLGLAMAGVLLGLAWLVSQAAAAL